MLVTRKSPLTGIVNCMDLDVTPEQMDEYKKGHKLIQDVFPDLKPHEREFIKTGYTQEDWNKMFPPEMDD